MTRKEVSLLTLVLLLLSFVVDVADASWWALYLTRAVVVVLLIERYVNMKKEDAR